MRRRLNFKLAIGIVLGLAVVAGLTHLLHEYQVRQNAHVLLERANQAMSEKKFGSAQGYYSQYLSFVPDDVDAMQKLAQAIDATDSSDGGRVKLVLLMEQVLRAKPGEDALRFRLVHNLIGLDRVAEARGHLLHLRKTWSDKAEVLHMLGWCLDALKKYPEAAQALQEAVAANPHQIKSYRILAEIWLDRLNDAAEAQKVLDDLVAKNGQDAQAYLARARFHRRRGDLDLAEKDVRQAYNLKPEDAEVIFETADAARLRGDWTEASRLLDDGLKRYPRHPDFYRLLADGKIAAGQPDEAIALLRDGVARAPKSSELAVTLIELLIERKQHDEARQRIDELVKAGMKPAVPRYLQARLRLADGQWSEAIALLEPVRSDLAQMPAWSGRVHVLLGLCYRHVGDRDQELQAFHRAVQDDPGWDAATVGLGEALLNNGLADEASGVLEPMRTLQHVPDGYWRLLARSRLMRQARTPPAERRWSEVDDALKHADPKETAVIVLRAEMCVIQGDFAAAQALLEKARDARPGEVPLWRALADLAFTQGRADDAERILAQAEAHPDLRNSIDVHLAQCRLYARRANPADLARLAKLGDQAASWPIEERTRLQRELADTWQRLGAWDRAERLYRDLAKALPKDTRSRFALMDLALQKNQPAAARVLQAELKQLEGDAGWQWRYGEAAILVHEAHGKRAQLADARKKLQALEKTHKHQPRVAWLLGALDELEGRYQAAIEQYARAVEMGDARPQVMVRYVELLMQRREFARAETEVARYEQKQALSRDLARLGAEAALGMRDARYARTALKRALQAVESPPRDYRDAVWLARFHDAAGDAAAAAKLLHDALEQAGHAPDVWLAWMEHLDRAGKSAAALADLDRMKKEVPRDRVALTLARCYEAIHRPDLAGPAYQAAVTERPQDFTVLHFVAEFYRRADQAETARGFYERLLEPGLSAPAETTTNARRHLAVLLAQAGNRARALALLDARSDAAPDLRIRWFIESSNPAARAGSIGRFQDSLSAQPPTSFERMLLAQMHEAAGSLETARTLLAEAVQDDPAPPQLARLARLLIQMGEMQEAERTIDHLDRLEPGSARVRQLRQGLVRDVQ